MGKGTQELPAPAPQEPALEPYAGELDKVSGEGLSGARLDLWTQIAEVTAGAPAEMGKFVTNLSAGRVKDQKDLAQAPDELVKELIDKFAGKK